MSASVTGTTDPSAGSVGGTTTYTTVINGVTEVVVVQNTVTVVQASTGVGSSSLATLVASQAIISGSESFTFPIPSTTSNGGGGEATAVTSVMPVTSSEVPVGSTVVVVVTAAAQSEAGQGSSADVSPNTPSSQSQKSVASSAAGPPSSTNDDTQATSSVVPGSTAAGDSFVFPTTLSSSAHSSSNTQSKTLAAVLNEEAASSSTNVHSATVSNSSVASSSSASGAHSTITASATGSSAGSTSNSSDSDVTYVYSGITLTGTAAAAAMAEAGSSTSTSSTVSGGGGSKLSSFAIVGIVAGVLVGLIVLYLLWYSWRKKAVQSKRQEMDLGEQPEEEKDQARPETMHSGFDFIDEPPSASSSRRPGPRRSIGRDPFDQGRESVAPDTETWYQDPNDVEYLSGNGNVGVGSQWNADDDGATALGENLHTGYSHSLFTTRLNPQRQMSEPAVNPFVPPVPPVPSTYASSLGRRVSDSGHLYPDHGLRPGTTVSHAESVNYENIYGGYADSGPGTFFVPDQTRDRATVVEPATSTLLGWDRPVGQPPVPPLSKTWRETLHEEDEMERMDGGHEIAGRVEDQYQENVAGWVREPVRAATAQTPVQHAHVGGAAAYPGFR